MSVSKLIDDHMGVWYVVMKSDRGGYGTRNGEWFERVEKDYTGGYNTIGNP